MGYLLKIHRFIFIKVTPCDEIKLHELVWDISSHFPIRLPAPTLKALYSPCEIRHLAIIVNLEVDPTERFSIKGCILILESWMYLALAGRAMLNWQYRFTLS